MVSRCLSNQFKQMEYQMDSVEEDSDVMPIQPGAPKKNVQFDTPLTSTRDITPRATPADSLDAEIPNEPESSVSNDTATHKRRNQIVDELPAKARHPISIQECVLRGEEYLKGYAVKSDRITRAIADIQKATMDLGLKMRPVVEGLVEYQKKLYDVMKQDAEFTDTLEEFIAIQEKHGGRETADEVLNTIEQIKKEYDETAKLLK